MLASEIDQDGASSGSARRLHLPRRLGGRCAGPICSRRGVPSGSERLAIGGLASGRAAPRVRGGEGPADESLSVEPESGRGPPEQGMAFRDSDASESELRSVSRTRSERVSRASRGRLGTLTERDAASRAFVPAAAAAPAGVIMGALGVGGVTGGGDRMILS